jgi:hypothetical protein
MRNGGARGNMRWRASARDHLQVIDRNCSMVAALHFGAIKNREAMMPRDLPGAANRRLIIMIIQ